jgi:hypothetical protein
MERQRGYRPGSEAEALANELVGELQEGYLDELMKKMNKMQERAVDWPSRLNIRKAREVADEFWVEWSRVKVMDWPDHEELFVHGEEVKKGMKRLLEKWVERREGK